MQPMAAQGTDNVVNLPSTPVGWSAGKWGEWYPDLLQPNGKLGIEKPKYWWQSGWRLQHDRLLKAASAMQRIPLFWSAGKWGEWYPDLLQPNGKLGIEKPKYWWQTGWRLQ